MSITDRVWTSPHTDPHSTCCPVDQGEDSVVNTYKTSAEDKYISYFTGKCTADNQIYYVVDQVFKIVILTKADWKIEVLDVYRSGSDHDVHQT